MHMNRKKRKLAFSIFISFVTFLTYPRLLYITPIYPFLFLTHTYFVQVYFQMRNALHLFFAWSSSFVMNILRAATGKEFFSLLQNVWPCFILLRWAPSNCGPSLGSSFASSACFAAG